MERQRMDDRAVVDGEKIERVALRSSKVGGLD
jgi:hypothetical protein